MKTYKPSLFLALILINGCDSPAFNHKAPNNPQIQSGIDCQLNFESSELCAKIEWIIGPNGEGDNSFHLKFWHRDDELSEENFIDPTKTIQVQLWMPSMGHGSAPVSIEKLEEGIYAVTNVEFIMPGDWDIRVKLVDGTNPIEQSKVSLIIP